ncbi:MAG: HAMP domain-containing histidine kinase [Clostridiales bacterium]|nr:HAMP domain-containing histidine kinase [Clostridiales bacterium]
MKKGKRTQKLKIDLAEVSRGQKSRELLTIFLIIVLIMVCSVLFAVFLYRLSEENIIYQLANLLHLSADKSALVVFLLYFFLTLVISLLIFSVIYFLFMAPFYELLNAIYEVAHDNYDIELHKKGRVGLIARTFRYFDIMCEKLKSVTDMQNDFIAMVSHEIKTPISVINGYAGLLQDDEIPLEKKQHYISQIVENSSQLSSMVQDMLLLSKFENQKITKDKAIYSLDNQIREVILLMEKQWTEKEIRFNLFLEDINICANESIVSHVWRNIISNAIKFSQPGGAITVSCRIIDDATVEVEVVDSGCGMSKEVQKHIFEKFYQADASHGSHGNGLGLALTKRIVDMYGGTITVSSEPGEGTVFTVIMKNCAPERPRLV